MSLSDGMPTMTMPVAPANTSGSGNGFGWGGDGAWWIIILFLFVFCGWGGNGWGNNGGNGGGVVDGYVLTSDFANVERKIDSVNDGLCNGFTSRRSSSTTPTWQWQTASGRQSFPAPTSRRLSCSS